MYVNKNEYIKMNYRKIGYGSKYIKFDNLHSPPVQKSRVLVICEIMTLCNTTFVINFFEYGLQFKINVVR